MGCYIKFLVITALLLQPSTQNSPIPLPLNCKQAADLLFLVDTSSSIWPKLYHRNMKDFLKKVIGQFHVGRGTQDTRVGVTLFSSGVYLQFHLNKYCTTEDVQAAVGRMPHRGGNTYTHLALRFAVDSMLTPQHGARDGMARLVVLITDGRSQFSKSTRKEAARLKATGADVFVIGVGRAVDMRELKAMASTPSEKFVYKVTDFRALMRINERFIQTTCQDCKGKPADIYFLLDAAYINNFEESTMAFVRKISAAYEISPMTTRIQLVTYADVTLKLYIGLGKVRLPKTLLRSLELENVTYLGNVANAAEAISFVKKRLGDGAARRGVVQLMIIVNCFWYQHYKMVVKAAEDAKKQGIYMFAVGVGELYDGQVLDGIASNPSKDFVFYVFKDLASITNLLAMKTGKAVANDSTYNYNKLPGSCSAQSLNVMFMYEYMNSIPNSKKVRCHFINHFTHQLAQYAPNTKVGIMTQSRAKDQVGLSNLVKELRMVKFYDAPLTETRVAVLVLDQHTQNHDELKREVRELRSQNVRIMVAAVGKVADKLIKAVATSPLEENTIRVDSYDDLKVKGINFWNKLCPIEFSGNPV